MAPKKQKMSDIRRFLRKTGDSSSSSSTSKENTQLGGATDSPPGGATGSAPGGATGSTPGGATGFSKVASSPKAVKKEYDGDSMTPGHLHRFKVQFSPSGRNNYTIDCDQPRTVLEAIKSIRIYKDKITCSDENIVIQLGVKDKAQIVATHFPCSCINNDETLIIVCESEKVEKANDQPYKPVMSRDKYSVFYIDTVGGKNTKTKPFLRNQSLDQFKFLCVYGEKGMTVEEALSSDGRFIDGLSDFTLSNNNDPNSITECTQKVDNLDQKEFKICLPRGWRRRSGDEKQQENPGASSASLQKSDAIMDVVKQSGIRADKPVKQDRISVRTAAAKNGGTEEIYKILCQQFPGLKDWMEKRFPADSYQKALELRKEDFGKIQHSFSEVHRVRKLLKLGESVCKVYGVLEGTGFVLFDNFVLTNAHLFTGCVEEQKLMGDAYVEFNYEDPELRPNKHFVKTKLIYYREGHLDYAILELEDEKFHQTTKTTKMKVPPGLLKNIGPKPLNGEACIIGHPAGEVKKLDPICVIEKEQREQAVNHNLEDFADYLFTVCAINHKIKNDPRADILMTYNTFMYHGASGSPLFDAKGRVFGLHTGGFFYGFPKSGESVLEFAQPLRIIFQHLVSRLKEHGNSKLLERVEKEAKGNKYLGKLLSDSDEPM